MISCQQGQERGRRAQMVKMFRGKLTRDLVIFCAGLAGIIHEGSFIPAWSVKEPHEALILAYLGMCGLPGILHLQEIANRKSGEGEKDEQQQRTPSEQD